MFYWILDVSSCLNILLCLWLDIRCSIMFVIWFKGHMNTIFLFKSISFSYTHPCHIRAHVLLLHNDRIVLGALREPRRVVVDVLYLDDDDPLRVPTGRPPTTPTVVRRRDVQAVRHPRLIQRAHERNDPGARLYLERSLREAPGSEAVCYVVTVRIVGLDDVNHGVGRSILAHLDQSWVTN